jgi:nitrite reductase/ring-hydroxylating ferredoxin subunit
VNVPTRPLCRLADLDDPGAKGMTVEQDGKALAVFVVRVGDRVFGYVNSCPHVGVPLDWDSGRFLDLERGHILCSSHFALFDMESGFCLRGPCQGGWLKAYPIVVHDGLVFAAPMPLAT